MEEKEPPAVMTVVILLVAVILIIFNLTFKTAMAATSGCKALPSYIAESCAASVWVFDGFRVCCDFLGRVSAECITTYLPEFAAAGVEDFSLFKGCLTLLPPVRAD